MTEPAVELLTVLTDERCALCRWARGWLESQPQLVRLQFVPAGGPLARQLYPWLDPDRTLREITVVSQDGRVWTDDAAWIAVLWATAEHRDLSLSLANERVRPLARGIIATVSRFRGVDACEPVSRG